MKKRVKCFIEDCIKLGRNKGYDNFGNRVWDRYCEMHHRLRTEKGKEHIKWLKAGIQKLSNKKCEVCGWDKGPCDRHRIVKEHGYKKENVIILCPNCHRLSTLGLLK